MATLPSPAASRVPSDAAHAGLPNAVPHGRPTRVALLAALAAGVGVLAAVGSVRHRTGDPLVVDRRLREAMRRRRQASSRRAALAGRERSATRVVSDTFGKLTGQWPPALAGAAAAAVVARRHGPRAALPALAAVPLANAAHAAIKYTLREQRPLLARLTGKRTPSFPSGHSARSAALAGVLAHLAAREQVAPAGAVLAAGATIALAGGANRAWVERHWVSDLVGGWALGAAAAAGCALWYDAVRARAR
jgi:undecaprenyl-diphosphatase